MRILLHGFSNHQEKKLQVVRSIFCFATKNRMDFDFSCLIRNATQQRKTNLKLKSHTFQVNSYEKNRPTYCGYWTFFSRVVHYSYFSWSRKSQATAQALMDLSTSTICTQLHFLDCLHLCCKIFQLCAKGTFFNWN